MLKSGQLGRSNVPATPMRTYRHTSFCRYLTPKTSRSSPVMGAKVDYNISYLPWCASSLRGSDIRRTDCITRLHGILLHRFERLSQRGPFSGPNNLIIQQAHGEWEEACMHRPCFGVARSERGVPSSLPHPLISPELSQIGEREIETGPGDDNK